MIRLPLAAYTSLLLIVTWRAPARAAEIVAYVSTLTEDSIVRLHDLNGDGDFNDAGESALFWGPGNADGFPGVGSAQTLLVLALDDLLAADGEETGAFVTRVYRLRDRNGDGDAMDPGEATVYWNSLLPLGVNFDRPKSITVGPDLALYLADNNTINFDNDTPEAVWRLRDLNADGDVNDPGEVTLYKELSPPAVPFGFVSEDYHWAPGGRLFFSNQSSSTNTGHVWIIEPDLSLTRFASDDEIVGISFDKTGMDLHPATHNPVFAGWDIFDVRRVIELIDINGNGVIDGLSEVLTRYRSDAAADPVVWGIPSRIMDVAFAPDGALWIVDITDESIYRFVDLTGDGDYNDPGESRLIYRASLAGAAGGFAMDFPRTVGFALLAAPGDADADDDVDLDDFAMFAPCFGGSGALAPPDGCDPRDFAALDLDCDGDLDLADFALFAEHFTG